MNVDMALILVVPILVADVKDKEQLDAPNQVPVLADMEHAVGELAQLDKVDLVLHLDHSNLVVLGMMDLDVEAQNLIHRILDKILN